MKMSLIRVMAAAGVFSVLACSASPSDEHLSDTSVIGGRLAEYHSFMVHLSNDGQDTKTGFCGGSWIAEGVILTAAHCVEGISDPAKVSISITKESDISAATSVKVRAIVSHPDFNPAVMHNDVALLFVDQPDHANLPRPVRPIALSADRTLPETAGNVTVIGWGNESSYGFLFGDDLRQVELPVVPLEQCRAAGGYYATVSDNEICAGDFAKGGIDSCQGDSGGPLVTVKDGQTYLVGVVSWGINCANKAKPGVYARVAAYTGWIYEQIGRYNTAAAETEADLKQAVAQHCYSGMSHKSLPYADDVAFEMMSNFKMDQPLAKLSGVPPLSQPVVSCSFKRTGLGQVRVDIGAEGDKPSVQIVLDNGNVWTGAVSDERSIETPCKGENEDSYVIELGTSSSWIKAEGIWFMVGDVIEDPDMTGYEQKNCAVHGTSLVFSKKAEDTDGSISYRATISSTEAGRPTKTYKLNKSSFSAGKFITAAAEIRGSSRTEGTLTFQNTTDEDIHTWVLSCLVDFTLTDTYGMVYQPVETGDDRFIHRFLTPASIHGIIAKDASVSFKVTFKESFDAEEFGQCNINGMPFSTVVSEEPVQP